MPFMKSFKKIVKRKVALLRSGGESMQSIADRANVSRMYLYNLVNDKDCSPTIDQMRSIAKALGFTVKFEVQDSA